MLKKQSKTKHCPRCDEDLSAKEFYKRSAAADGLSSYCKCCTKEYNSERLGRIHGTLIWKKERARINKRRNELRAKNPEAYLAKEREQRQRSIERRIDELYAAGVKDAPVVEREERLKKARVADKKRYYKKKNKAFTHEHLQMR